MQTVKWRKRHPDAVIPTIAKAGDAGFDFYTIEDVIVLPGETVVIQTGLSMELPPNTEMQVRPRSGMALETPYIIKNSPGTVDEGYRGPLNIIVHCLMNAQYEGKDTIEVDIDGHVTNMADLGIVTMNMPLIIKKGDRIAQGVIKPVINRNLKFVVANELADSERGEGGFGHSGQ